MKGSIMIQGTMSNAGKRVLAGGLCRVLKQDGYSVAPFKSQNMALNSFITKEGLEMGRAQVMQAEAAGIEPAAAMNPILLKPTNDTGSQVIIGGKPVRTMSAVEYYKHKRSYIPYIMESYGELKKKYDVIVIEGAGSPAEINLKQDDIVNMGLAELVDAPVLLAGDIDRGGVFAQLIGTVMLLEEKEQQRIKGMIINKFRGDVSILKPGLTMLEERAKIPVLGVVPYFNLDIDEEDSLTERFQKKEKEGLVDIAVIRLPRISNFTDIAPLEVLEEAGIRYVSTPGEFGEPDAVILPGSKNTISDLLWMRQNGLEARLMRFASKGGLIFGICGGYQMLGQEVSDPDGIEQKGTIRGLGLLPTRTVFDKEKTRTRVQGRFLATEGILKELSGTELEGYEIHMGETFLLDHSKSLVEFADIADKNGSGASGNSGNVRVDGAQCGNVYGCYVHGIFDAAGCAKGFLSALLKKKGYDPSDVQVTDWKAYKEGQYDKLADIIRESLDMERIYQIIEKGNDASCSL